MLVFEIKTLDIIGADWHPGLYLSDVLATSYHGVVDTGVKKGDIVGIWGAGKQTSICTLAASLTFATRTYWTDVRRLFFHARCIPGDRYRQQLAPRLRQVKDPQGRVSGLV